MEIKDLNNLLSNAINLQKKQRRRTVFVVVILAIIGGLLFYSSNFFTAKTVTEKIQKDSTITNPVYKSVLKKQNDEIQMIVQSYFDARKNKDLEEISKFYADTTFDFFYSYPNQFQKEIKILTKKEILKIERIDFRKNDNRVFDFEDFISVTQVSNCTEIVDCDLIIFVRGKQFNKEKMYDAILEIKLKAKNHKIYSIRPYIDSFRKI